MDISNVIFKRALFLKTSCLFPTTRECVDKAVEEYPEEFKKALVSDVVLFHNVTKEEYIADIVSTLDHYLEVGV